MRKNMILTLALASAMTLAPFAIATAAGQDGAAHADWHGRGHGHDLMSTYAKLNLSDAQKANIRQILQNASSQTKTQRQNLRQQREAFEQMAPNASDYQAAASTLAQAEGAATQARVQQRAAIRAQIYAVLTPAQQAQLATMKAEHQARRQQWEQFKAQHPVTGSSSAK